MQVEGEERVRRWRNDQQGSTSTSILIFFAVLGAGYWLYLDAGSGAVGSGSAALDQEEKAIARAPLSVRPQVPQESVRKAADQPGKTAEMLFWEQVERDRQEPASETPGDAEGEQPNRQTSFNDLNYTPPKQVNIIQSVPVRSAEKSSSSDQKILSGSKRASVHWEDARGEISRWKTRFDFNDGRIDNSTFCLNVGKGSIPYRECRKGAQQWLKEQCRTDRQIGDNWRRMYCHAYRSYRS